MGLGVREVEGAAEDVGDLVVHARSRRGEGDGGEVGAVERGLEPRQCGGFRAELRQTLAQRPDAFEGERPVDRVGGRGPQRVDAVGEGVEARGDGEVVGQVAQEVGVVDDRARQHRIIDPGALAAVLGAPPHVRRLGAGERRGHGDDRDPRLQRDRLRQPRCRTATDADDEVDVADLGGGHGTIGHLSGHVHDDLPVPQSHREVVGEVGDLVRGGSGDDDHDPFGPEALDLRGDCGSGLPGA